MKEPEPIVLVVDDDDSLCRGVERLLRSVGLNAATFVSAQEFMHHPPPEGPACHVLDVRLPGMSGLELQQELVAAGLDLPVIFLTGHATVPMSVHALKTGAADFLQKPVEEQVLLDAIHQALERHRQAKAREADLLRLRRRADALTARECEVFGLVVTGLANKEIAAFVVYS
jgi:FixJ family two-component response regulator